MLDKISIFKIYQVLFCGPPCDLSRKIFHVHVKKMSIVLLSNGMLYKSQLSPIRSNVLFKACGVSLFILDLNDLSIDVRWVLMPLLLLYYCQYLLSYTYIVLYGRRQWHPTSILLLGKSHRQRSLVGCSPWGR